MRPDHRPCTKDPHRGSIRAPHGPLCAQCGPRQWASQAHRARPRRGPTVGPLTVRECGPYNTAHHRASQGAQSRSPEGLHKASQAHHSDQPQRGHPRSGPKGRTVGLTRGPNSGPLWPFSKWGTSPEGLHKASQGAQSRPSKGPYTWAPVGQGPHGPNSGPHGPLWAHAHGHREPQRATESEGTQGNAKERNHVVSPTGASTWTS